MELNAQTTSGPGFERGTHRQPNVLIILADDLGFSDLGCYGGEIETPNLDRLATQGVRMTNFYNTARCWSTRASLLTGYYAQQVGFDKLPGSPASSRQRPAWATLLPEMLTHRGYRCFHSGKWHLDALPCQTGFEFTYSLDDHGRFFSPQRHRLNDRALPAVGRDEGYYATSEIADRAIHFLQQINKETPDKPFFGFVAFTAPHFPLHALPEDVAKYAGRYEMGWDEIRKQRHRRQRELKLMYAELSQPEMDIGPPYSFPDAIQQLGPGEVNRPFPWEQLNAEQQVFQTRKMELHAAMVDRMDQEIGRILQELATQGRMNDTLVLFLSDNGASAEIMIRDDGHDPTSEPGSAASHLCLGPGWSNAANTPFRRHKTWVHEGGCRTPLIASWPAGLPLDGVIERDSCGHVIDIVPSILQVSRVRSFAQPAGETSDAWATLPETVVTRPGVPLPWLPAVKGDAEVEVAPASPRELWFCHEGHCALRQGDWKAVKGRDEAWELFDLKHDPSEQYDLAAKQNERLNQMIDRWEILATQFASDSQR